ncbi:hypothetical protein ACLOJK_039465 [Asimina triloba]
MESSGARTSFVRNRSIVSSFHTVFRSAVDDAPPAAKVHPKEAEAPAPSGQGSNGGAYVEDDSWIAVLVSWLRIVTCFVLLTVTTFVWAVVMLVLVPWPAERIKQGNIYGHLSGKMLVNNSF